MHQELRHFLPALALAGLLSFTGGRAHAETATPDSPAPARIWYGWQNATIDAFAVGLTLPLVLRDEPGALLLLAFVGPPAYGVGGPIVHFAHGQIPKGLASLGLRLGMPPVVGAVGSFACSSEQRGSCFVGIAVASMVVAMVLDDTVLAYEDAPRATQTASTAFRLHPTFTLDRHGATAGVGLTL